MKGRIKTANLNGVGKGLLGYGNGGEVMRLVQGGEGPQIGQRRQYILGQDNRRGKLRAAMHNAVADASDGEIGQRPR